MELVEPILELEIVDFEAEAPVEPLRDRVRVFAEQGGDVANTESVASD